MLLGKEAVRTLGFMPEVSAITSESDAFGYLRAPIKRPAGLDIPIPYALKLERASVPQGEGIVAATTDLVRKW